MRPTLEVARDLIGKMLVYRKDGNRLIVRLTDVEAYIGEDDPACHAAVGRTVRNEIMYGIGGFSYIYFIYGMYHCLNVVTEQKDYPSAILLRGAEPIEGLELMKINYPEAKNGKYTNGPGKLCRALNLTRAENGLDLTKDTLYFEDHDYIVGRIEASGRIGINKGKKRKWRFFDPDSEWLSV